MALFQRIIWSLCPTRSKDAWNSLTIASELPCDCGEAPITSSTLAIRLYVRQIVSDLFWGRSGGEDLWVEVLFGDVEVCSESESGGVV